MEEMLKQILGEIKSMKSEIIDIKASQARMEHDHGTKLAALLDGYHQNAEILDCHTEQLDNIESKVGKHDVQISILDRTKSNRRRAK